MEQYDHKKAGSSMETEILDIAKNIPKIKELYEHREELQTEANKLQTKINEIDRQIRALLKTSKQPKKHPGAFETYEHPNEGTVGYDIVEILGGNEPKTQENILMAVNSKREKKISKNTIRSYLTNFKCFKRVAKNQWTYVD